MKEAAYYSKLNNNAVRCGLCPHHCRIREGGNGICLTRENRRGVLISANYCKPVSIAIDPVEKKPLFHFYPGSSIFSTGPNGCTFKCGFCQNFEISQDKLRVRELPVEELVAAVRDSGTIGIAYTYSEPTIWYETIMDAGQRIKELGLKNVMVTNGFIEEQPLADLLRIVDAMNIDIKSMNPSFYRRVCKGSLAPVLRTCETAKKAGCHVEITNLLIPGENDSPQETEVLVKFISEHLGADTPLHISRYFPRYQMRRAPTPAPIIDRAWEIAKQRLSYVYAGNITAAGKENTACPVCGTLLVSRQGYHVHCTPELLKDPPGAFTRCGKCGRPVNLLL